MKINWGLVIGLFLLAGIGSHMLRSAPVREQSVPLPMSRPADVPVREHLQKLPIPDIPVREEVRMPPPADIPLLPQNFDKYTPVAVPPARIVLHKPVVKRTPPPKPKESTARPTYRRVLKDGVLGGQLACAKVRPLTESERAEYENSDDRTLFVCLN